MLNAGGKIIIRSSCSGVCSTNKRGDKLLEEYVIGQID